MAARQVLFVEFGRFDYGGEGRWLVDCEFCQDFSVQADVCRLESGDETAVGRAVFSGGRIDTRVPQSAEGAFAVASITVGELQTTRGGLFGPFDADAVRMAKALGCFADFIVFGPCGDPSFDSHCATLPASYGLFYCW